ncbi:MAG: FAD-dependent oxidoreductase, partial [Verrucomicrobiae bacterium]|nr:FAD-dependent oxidoreductase [Verrucomicrobiae bacterium]
MRQRVAIIGTGIAGMACARSLSDQFDLTILEKNDYFGGHTNTVMVREGSKEIPIDTGFMVYNKATYPHLVRLFDELKVETAETDMSFGVQNLEENLEYACSGLNTFFAQRRNALHPSQWMLLTEILRFFKVAESYLTSGYDQTETLQAFLDQNRFKPVFIENYLLPMTAAIWSTPPGQMLDYPAKALLGFLKNHQLLGVGIQLKWRTVKGGSQSYRDKLLQPLQGCLRKNSRVEGVREKENQMEIKFRNGMRENFDFVVIAAHADQALGMLECPTHHQERLLGAFRYTTSPVVLHSDESVMPKNRRAWASWNFRMERNADGQSLASTHYWMNRLQKVSREKNYFISVNYDGKIDPEKIHWDYTYEHPTFTAESIAAQKEL